MGANGAGAGGSGADRPVVLVHGWGGSFAETWAPGFAPLLEDMGRRVVGVDLLGHGTAPKPHDPEAYADLTERVFSAIEGEPEVDAVGFSLGAMTLLEAAAVAPERFHRLVVAGVGDNLFRRDEERRAAILRAVDGAAGIGPAGAADADDVGAGMFAQYASQPGNDAAALAAVLRRVPVAPLSRERLALVSVPVLVVIGDKDFAGPGDPLVEALPDARQVVLRNVDHFATPEAFGFWDAALDFLA